jgi:hypothetical protein
VASTRQSAESSSGCTDSTTLRTFYRSRTLREKVVFEVDTKGDVTRVLSVTAVQVGPTVIGDWAEGDSPYPALDEAPRRERNEVGKWSRRIKASKRFGLDGDEDNGD